MIDAEPLSVIENFIRKFISPDKNEWNEFAEILSVKSLHKKELLLSQGQTCSFIAFVINGILREYSNEKDKEVTVDFICSGTFATDYTSFLMQRPTSQNIEALTDAQVILLHKKDIDPLYDRYKIWERFGRLMAERIFCNVEIKRKNMISKGNEELWNDFVKQYPDVIQQVPQYHIASYLGLTPEHLSRLRKKI